MYLLHIICTLLHGSTTGCSKLWTDNASWITDCDELIITARPARVADKTCILTKVQAKAAFILLKTWTIENYKCRRITLSVRFYVAARWESSSEQNNRLSGVVKLTLASAALKKILLGIIFASVCRSIYFICFVHRLHRGMFPYIRPQCSYMHL